jgi:hypothetical protein
LIIIIVLRRVSLGLEPNLLEPQSSALFQLC